jgi:hypothetical protein
MFPERGVDELEELQDARRSEGGRCGRRGTAREEQVEEFVAEWIGLRVQSVVVFKIVVSFSG